MRTITLPRQTVINAASSRGITPCEEVSRLLSASFGREVCSPPRHKVKEGRAMIDPTMRLTSFWTVYTPSATYTRIYAANAHDAKLAVFRRTLGRVAIADMTAERSAT